MNNTKVSLLSDIWKACNFAFQNYTLIYKILHIVNYHIYVKYPSK